MLPDTTTLVSVRFTPGLGGKSESGNNSSIVAEEIDP
jgi:hypothetical protein